MKVKCINNKNTSYSLTIGKEYEVEKEDSKYYWVVDDNGVESPIGFFKTRFEIVDKVKENWDKFSKDKLVVLCDTEEKADKFIKECSKRNMEWSSSKHNTNWNYYKENTCYNYYIGSLVYASKQYFKKDGYTVVKCEDMFEEEKIVEKKLIKGKKIEPCDVPNNVGAKVFIEIKEGESPKNLAGENIDIKNKIGVIENSEYLSIFANKEVYVVSLGEFEKIVITEGLYDRKVTIYEAVDGIEEDNTETGEPVRKKRTPEERIKYLQRKLSMEKARTETYYQEILRLNKEIETLKKESDHWEKRFLEATEVQIEGVKEIKHKDDVIKIQERVIEEQRESIRYWEKTNKINKEEIRELEEENEKYKVNLWNKESLINKLKGTINGLENDIKVEERFKNYWKNRFFESTKSSNWF